MEPVIGTPVSIGIRSRTARDYLRQEALDEVNRILAGNLVIADNIYPPEPVPIFYVDKDGDIDIKTT